MLRFCGSSGGARSCRRPRARAGAAPDLVAVEPLLACLHRHRAVADKGFAADTFRARLCRQRTRVCTPPKRTRRWPVAFHRGYNRRHHQVTPLSWFGVFYNDSSNFRPANADQVDIFGRALPYEAGQGKDYGVKLYLFEGKVTVSLDWFKTDFKNQSTRGPRAGPVGSFDAPRVASLAATQNYYTDLGTPQLADKWNQRGYLNNDTYFDTQDYASKGWEASLTASPTDNWRVTLNVSKQRNVTSNVAPRMREWAKSIHTVLTDPVLLALPTTQQSADGIHCNTVAQNLNLIDQRIVGIASLEGFADQRQPELSANVVTAYDFKRGPLKNFGVGGSLRWRGYAIVGYKLLNSTSAALDGNKPYWNNSSIWTGVFVNCRAKLFKKVGMRLQLNVDNALDADRPNAMLSRQVNGQRVDNRWALVAGRSYAFSANFEF